MGRPVLDAPNGPDHHQTKSKGLTMADGDNAPHGVNGASKLEKLANSVIAMLISRYVMPLVGIVVVWAGTQAFNRVDTSLKNLETFQHNQAKANELMQQQIDFRAKARDTQIQGIEVKIGDHETRIRGLERRPN